jgi:hypothetical protein
MSYVFRACQFYRTEVGFPSNIDIDIASSQPYQQETQLPLYSPSATSLQNSQHFDWPTNISIEANTITAPLHDNPTIQHGV